MRLSYDQPSFTKVCLYLTGQGGAGGKPMKGYGWPSYGGGNSAAHLVVRGIIIIHYDPTVTRVLV